MIDNIRKLVRPFVSVCFVGLTVYLGITGKIDAEKILTLTGIIVAFHFGERSALKNDTAIPGA